MLLGAMDLLEEEVEEFLLKSLAGMKIQSSLFMGGEVLAVPQMQVLQGHSMMLFLEDSLLTITTCQQILIRFSSSFLITLSGQTFIFRIMHELLFLYFGVVYRFEDNLVYRMAPFCPSGLYIIPYQSLNCWLKSS